MPETRITAVGNVVDDPDLRFTPSGAAVCNFRVASTPRNFNKVTQEWSDGDTLWLSCSVWREQAENAAATLSKGARVIVTGSLRMRPYETRDGEKRTSLELDVEDVGVALRFATATIQKVARPADPRHADVLVPAGAAADEPPF